MEYFYHVQLKNNKNLYQKLDEIDPDHEKRKKGPDDHWYPHVPSDDYPECEFWWTEKGFEIYKKTGLLDFHQNLIDEKFEIQKAANPKNIMYKDEYQIAIKNKDLEMIS